MTDYSRGYAAGLKAAADSIKGLGTTYISIPYAADQILSLPIVGEADQRGAAAGGMITVGSILRAASHPNPGEQVPDSARVGGSHITSSPDSQGPSQECVSVPLPDFDSLVNIASPSPCVAVDGYCVECGASLPLDESCWKLAAAKEEHDAHR